MPNIQIREFNNDNLPNIIKLIHLTIDTSYSEVYPREAIQFFKDYHSAEHILDDAGRGFTIIAEINHELLGTGTLIGTNIRRFFVHPFYQRKGIGTSIFRELGNKALLDKLHSLDLDASLISVGFWKSHGFEIENEECIFFENKQKLPYYKMRKKL